MTKKKVKARGLSGLAAVVDRKLERMTSPAWGWGQTLLTTVLVIVAVLALYAGYEGYAIGGDGWGWSGPG